jgi:rhodanese-related sulfurtransferase
VGERAVRAFQALGYTNVKEYRGGKQEWADAGLPMESSPPSMFEALKYALGVG